MSFYSLPPLFCSLLALSLGLFVYFHNRRSHINISFALLCLCTFGWQFSWFILFNITKQEFALSLVKIGYLWIIFIPAVFFNFFRLFLSSDGIDKYFTRISYVAGVVFTIFLLSSHYFIKGVYRYYWGFYPEAGILHPFYLLVLFIVVARAVFILLSSLNKEKRFPQRYNQIKYILLALFFYIPASADFIVNYGVEFYPLGFVSVIIAFLIFSYTIVRFRLLDINLAITRAGIFAVVYFPIIFVPFWLGSKFIYTNLWWIPISLMGILATLGVFIFNSLRRQTENKILAKDLIKYAILKRFSAALSKMRDIGPDRLCKLILYRLVRIMGISRGVIYLADEDGNRCIPKAVYTFRGTKVENLEELLAENSLVKFITAYRKEFMIDDLQRLSSDPLPGIDYAQVIAQMRQLKVVLIIPSFLENKLFGFLVLGEKSAGRPYSKSDIEVLATLSHSASLAILNATFALKLKDKERELADKSRIIEIGNLASATGHQLGNVLNNIINFGCGILDNDAILEALKDHPKAMADFDKLVKMIITDAQDGDRIIEEIRGYSRQEGNRELSSVNLKDVLDRTLGILYIQVNRFQNIGININISPDVPLVLASPVGMQNIFVNMLNNSYDSIQEIKAYLQSHPEIGLNGYKGRIDINISRSKDKVDIRISDNGMGMTEDISRRLFTPNYTTKASIDKRREIKLSGGTGIGLFTIRFLLNDYGGTVKLCRTEPLKGADFLIQLPIPRG